ncbi:MAG: hypothetical protein Q4A60_09300 [Pasteurellaceae bacterium]|nr:hypothetical protein [Pasteurellaceae bacterium]
MVDKLPNSKNDGYKKPDGNSGGGSKRDPSPSDATRKTIQEKVDKILNK